MARNYTYMISFGENLKTIDILSRCIALLQYFASDYMCQRNQAGMNLSLRSSLILECFRSWDGDGGRRNLTVLKRRNRFLARISERHKTMKQEDRQTKSI